MSRVSEERTLKAKVRDRIKYEFRHMGMCEWEEIRGVDVDGLVSDIIEWADRRERRHAKTPKATEDV